MGWTWDALMATPAPVVDRIIGGLMTPASEPDPDTDPDFLDEDD